MFLPHRQNRAAVRGIASALADASYHGWAASCKMNADGCTHESSHPHASDRRASVPCVVGWALPPARHATARSRGCSEGPAGRVVASVVPCRLPVRAYRCRTESDWLVLHIHYTL
eukprot:COSAG02_NODE_8936_length_2393_cov_14.935920_4_plen_114_part_01